MISGAPGPVGSASGGCQGVCIPHKLSGNQVHPITEHTLCNADRGDQKFSHAGGWKIATTKEKKEWLPSSPQRSIVSRAENGMGLEVVG